VGHSNGNGKQRLLSEEDEEGIEMAVLIESDGLAEHDGRIKGKAEHHHAEEEQVAIDDGYFASSAIKAKVRILHLSVTPQ